MKCIPVRKWGFILSVFSIIPALLVFCLQPARPASAEAVYAFGDYFIVAVGQPQGVVCLGETKMIGVTWMMNDSSSALAAISGPTAITVNAKRGTLSRHVIHPDGISGTVFIEYKADAVGHERIDVQAFVTSEQGDATDKAEFEVKQCKYRFTYTATLFDDLQEDDVQMAIEVNWLARGTLIPSDLTNSRLVEGKDKLIKVQELITSYSLPNCTYSTMEPARGFGFIDARAYPGSGSSGMVLEFSPPKDLSFNMGVTLYCEGDPQTIAGTYPYSASEDPWIVAIFPEGQGTQNITVSDLQEAVDRMNSYPGHRSSYTATVTLERVEE
jgi:hypothetical protein